MREDKIQLPDFMIAELYKESLVDLNKYYPAEVVVQQPIPVAEPVETPGSENIQFLGGNKKRVTIVVEEREAAFLMEDDLLFLTNILKACQLGLADIAIINLAKQSVDYETLKATLSPEKILLFDVEPSVIKLPFMIPAFQLQKFDECQVMVAPPLANLNQPSKEGKLLKTKLWLALKQIFNIP
jgi:hypothetical protein